jgi:predicted aspartyl protease
LEVEALVDTGFDGALVLPGWPVPGGGSPDTHMTWRLADGSMVDAPAYAAEVHLLGLDGVYPVLVSILGDEAVVGRG